LLINIFCAIWCDTVTRKINFCVMNKLLFSVKLFFFPQVINPERCFNAWKVFNIGNFPKDLIVLKVWKVLIATQVFIFTSIFTCTGKWSFLVSTRRVTICNIHSVPVNRTVRLKGTSFLNSLIGLLLTRLLVNRTPCCPDIECCVLRSR